mgnify:CR=1 FL=1
MEVEGLPPYLLKGGWFHIGREYVVNVMCSHPPVLIKERATPYWEREGHFPKMQTNMHLRGVWYALKGG